MELDVASLNGYSIPATLEEASGTTHGVVLSHGIFVTRSENGRFDRLAPRLAKIGMSSVRFDLPGHGSSPIPSRDMSVSGMVTSLADVAQWMSDRYEKVSIVASSFSGALFALADFAGLLPPLHRIVLLNPVLDFDNVFVHAARSEMAEIFSPENMGMARNQGVFTPVAGYEMSREFLQDLNSMVVERAYASTSHAHLVVHGTSDELVAYERAVQIVDQNEAATFMPIEGGVHAFTQSGHEDVVMELAANWLRS